MSAARIRVLRATGPARLVVVVLAALASLAVAGPASAHVGGGVAGSDYAGRVLSVSPPMPGVTVRVLQFGDDVEVDNGGPAEVTVTGYNEEPYLRIGPAGVFRNANSPATYLNLDPYGRLRSLPAGVSGHAAPRWEQVSTRPRYVWHDHRTHWMTPGVLPPTVAADPSVPHTVFRWSLPMQWGGTPVRVSGVLSWSPPPPPGLVWPCYVVLFLVPLAAGVLAPGPRPFGALLLLVAAAAVWNAVTTPAPPPTQGSSTGALVSALLPAVLTLAVAAAGLRAGLRGRGTTTGLLAVVVGWLALVQGLPDVDALWSSHVLAVGPATASRTAVAVMVAMGGGCVLGGIAAARRFRGPAVPTPPAVAEPLPGGSSR